MTFEEAKAHVIDLRERILAEEVWYHPVSDVCMQKALNHLEMAIFEIQMAILEKTRNFPA